MEEMTEQEAIAFFAKFYNGAHHIPGFKPIRSGYGWSVKHDRGELATFDFTGMTKLVIMAHDQCIRVGVEAVRTNVMRITIWKRKGREGSITERHPELEEAIKSIRSYLANQD